MGNSLFFPTGRNCKIQVNGVTLAYATNLSYKVDVPHVATKTLGIYEVNSIEPTSYKVEGSFSIIKYTRGAVKKLTDKGLSTPSGANNSGNGIGSWVKDGGANASLDPSKLQYGETFDIFVFERLQENTDRIFGFTNCRIIGVSAEISNKTTINQTFQFVAQYYSEDSFVAGSSGVGQLTT